MNSLVHSTSDQTFSEHSARLDAGHWGRMALVLEVLMV